MPSTRGLNTSVVIERLGPLLVKWAPKLHIDTDKITQELALIHETASARVQIPQRTPTFSCVDVQHDAKVARLVRH